MSSSTLQLKAMLNKPESLDMSREWATLEQAEAPAILVYGEKFAHAVLKSKALAPNNLMSFWKILNKIPSSDLPFMDGYFSAIPLFLHQEAHRIARKKLNAPYRRIEQSLDQWLPLFTRQYLSGFSDNETQNPIILSNKYLTQVFKEIIARDISCPAEELPALSANTFSLLPRADGLRKFEAELKELVNAIEKSLATYGGNAEDLWPLTSIAVMGREPMLGAFVFGLMNPPPDQTGWTGESLMHAAAAVDVLARLAQEDITIEGVKLVKGQLIQVCPFIAHKDNAKENQSAKINRSLSFGTGLHVCQGRAIAIKIADIFFNELHLNGRIRFDSSGIKLVRDFLIQPKEQA